MEASELADLFRKMGLRVIKAESCWWYSPQRFLFKSIPVIGWSSLH